MSQIKTTSYRRPWSRRRKLAFTRFVLMAFGAGCSVGFVFVYVIH